ALTRLLLRLGGIECGALLPRDVGLLARVFPVLRRVEAIGDLAARAERQAAGLSELRARAFAAFRDLLARLSAERGIVIAIDDFHWADAETISLLRDVLAPPDPPGILAVLVSLPSAVTRDAAAP